MGPEFESRRRLQTPIDRVMIPPKGRNSQYGLALPAGRQRFKSAQQLSDSVISWSTAEESLPSIQRMEKIAMVAQTKFWSILKRAGWWYLVTLGLALLASLFSWFMWYKFGANQTIPARYLITAHCLALLNVVLSLIALEREPFASSLLAGSTLIYELLIIVFLYLI